MREVSKEILPVDYIQGNLLVTPKPPTVFDRRLCWAGYELEGMHYDFTPADKAVQCHSDLARLFQDLSDVPEVHMIMVPEPLRAAETQLRVTRSPRLSADAADYCNQVAEVLRSFDEQDDLARFRFYLFVRLPSPSAVRSVLATASGVRDFLEGLGGLNRPEIPLAGLENWRQAERDLRVRLQGFAATTAGMRFRPLTALESMQRLRLPFWRSLCTEPGFSDGWEPGEAITTTRNGQLLITPDSGAIRRLYGGLVDHEESEGYLKVTQMVLGEPKTAYQAFLTVEQFSPNPLPLFGGEWAYSLQQLVGPVELHIRWTAQDYERTLADLASQKRKQADTSDQEQEHEGGTSTDTFRSRDETEEMEAYIKDSRSACLKTSIVLVISAPTPDVLRQRIRSAYGVFDRLDIKLAHNGPDQYRHFTETIPGAARQVDDYVHRLLPPALATSMIGTTTDLMDRSGLFLGLDPLGRPLFWDPLKALAVLDTSGSAAFLGPLGKGKSLAANLMAFLAVLVYGARLLAIDSAKPERSHWPEALPYLGPMTNVVTLSRHEADRGKLDPYVIFPDRTEATNHAVSQAAFLTQVRLQDAGYDVLLRAFTEVRDGSGRPCMTAGIRILERLARDSGYKYRPVAERLAERLRNMATMAYANLLFGDGTGQGIDISKPITVLQLDGIRKPPEKPLQEYTLDEYLSHAIMVAAVAFASAYARQDRRTQKIILADEIRWFVNNGYGRDLIEQQTLIGRAMGVQVFLIGQNVSHLPADLHQHFGLRLAFGAATEREAVATLNFLGAEPTRENIERLLWLNPGEQKGECLIRDLHGRIGQAQIMPLFAELIEAFNTRSLTREAAD